MAVKIYHGDIVICSGSRTSYADTREQLYHCGRRRCFPDLRTGSGAVSGALEVVDYGDKLIIPAFSDLHVHGAQYVQRGIGMDCLLSDWLNHYTFPQESRFANMEYAKNCYDAFVNDMIRNGTFHANVFATIHGESYQLSLRKDGREGHVRLCGKSKYGL